jgi:hypothetical protein
MHTELPTARFQMESLPRWPGDRNSFVTVEVSCRQPLLPRFPSTAILRRALPAVGRISEVVTKSVKGQHC